MTWRTRLALVCLWLLCTGATPEQKRFGSKGQNVVFGQLSLAVAIGDGGLRTSIDSTIIRAVDDEPTGNDIRLTLMPGWLHFVSEDFALGTRLSLSYASMGMRQTPYEKFSVGTGLLIGYNVPIIATGLSWFPHLTLGGGYATITYEAFEMLYEDPTGGNYLVTRKFTWSGPYVSADVALPLQVHLAAAVYLGIGPRFYIYYATDEGPLSIETGLSVGLGAVF